MHQSDLHLDPNEASDLCIVFDDATLERRGWDRAFLTVLDEAPAEEALAILGHEDGAAPGEAWEALRVSATPTGAPADKTEDAEACARLGEMVYVMGSQFGKKAGPLAASRSWIARIHQAELAKGVDGGRPELEIARTRFGLHRAMNDALRESGIDLIPLGPKSEEGYIRATIDAGEKKRKVWAGRVKPGDYPINVEGMEFRANGNLLIGVRFPVTAEGHPLLIELADVDSLFDDVGGVPRCSGVWVLDDVGSADSPAGVRALHSAGDDTFDAVVGDLDAPDKGATVLEDHPEGRASPSAHVRFELPARKRGGSVGTRTIHDFGDVRRVEGVVVDGDGHAHYVIDEEGHVALRTLLFD